MKAIRLALCAILLGPAMALAKVGGGDVTLSVPKGGNVTFSHDAHVANAGLVCTQCHDKVFVTQGKHQKATMKDMQKGKSCGACHNGQKAFSVKESCESCHKK